MRRKGKWHHRRSEADFRGRGSVGRSRVVAETVMGKAFPAARGAEGERVRQVLAEGKQKSHYTNGRQAQRVKELGRCWQAEILWDGVGQRATQVLAENGSARKVAAQKVRRTVRCWQNGAARTLQSLKQQA